MPFFIHSGYNVILQYCVPFSKVLGTLMEAREIINEVNADAVVIACEVSPEWMKVVRKMLEPTGVKVTHFSFNETKVM